MKNLEERVTRLEQRAEDCKPFVPPLFHFSSHQTLEEAKAEYRQKHGVDFPADGLIVEFQTIDATREGNGRVIKLGEGI